MAMLEKDGIAAMIVPDAFKVLVERTFSQENGPQIEMHDIDGELAVIVHRDGERECVYSILPEGS